MILVWEPLYRTMFDKRVGEPVCLISKSKVKKGRNIIVIKHPEKKGAYDGRYEMGEIAIRSYPQTTNGVIPVYAVPMSKLRRIK